MIGNPSDNRMIKINNTMSRKVCFEAGYKQCKEDVLKLIDEVDQGQDWPILKILKARITG